MVLHNGLIQMPNGALDAPGCPHHLNCPMGTSSFNKFTRLWPSSHCLFSHRCYLWSMCLRAVGVKMVPWWLHWMCHHGSIMNIMGVPIQVNDGIMGVLVDILSVPMPGRKSRKCTLQSVLWFVESTQLTLQEVHSIAWATSVSVYITMAIQHSIRRSRPCPPVGKTICGYLGYPIDSHQKLSFFKSAAFWHILRFSL